MCGAGGNRLGGRWWCRGLGGAGRWRRRGCTGVGGGCCWRGGWARPFGRARRRGRARGLDGGRHHRGRTWRRRPRSLADRDTVRSRPRCCHHRRHLWRRRRLLPEGRAGSACWRILHRGRAGAERRERPQETREGDLLLVGRGGGRGGREDHPYPFDQRGRAGDQSGPHPEQGRQHDDQRRPHDAPPRPGALLEPRSQRLHRSPPPPPPQRALRLSAATRPPRATGSRPWQKPCQARRAVRWGASGLTARGRRLQLRHRAGAAQPTRPRLWYGDKSDGCETEKQVAEVVRDQPAAAAEERTR